MNDFGDFGFNSSAEQEEQNDEGSSSEATSSTSDEENDGAEQGFEVSEEVGGIASLIALNQIYSDLVDRLITKVEHLLKNNQDEQKKIRQFISSKKTSDRPETPVFRALFLPPYFKDTFNMVPPLNNESREIRGRCSVNQLMREKRPWTKEELRLLKKPVVAQLIEIKNREVVARRDFLRDKILNYRAEDQIDQLTKCRKELEEVMRRLNYLNTKDYEAELKTASFDNID